MKIWLALIVTVVLTACAHKPVPPSQGGYTPSPSDNIGRYSQEHDAAPTAPPSTDHVQEPIPKHEPKSRYGNPTSYVVRGKTYYVMNDARGYNETGGASWYGTKFQGHRTSSGETYDMYQYTAAHKTLPLPTYARVTNLDNGTSVMVKINDRGPFHPDRIIDLSWVAAKKLDILAKGTGNVRVEAIIPAIGPTEPTSPTATSTGQTNTAKGKFLQVGAYQNQAAAQQQQTYLQSYTAQPSLSVQQAGLYKVWLGPFVSDDERIATRQQLEQQGIDSIPVNSP